MKTLGVGELKADFSAVLDEVCHGHSVAIGYGKQKKRLAVIVPYSEYMKSSRRKLGVLKGRAGFKIHDDFGMTDEEFLLS
jgi:antitoxin (DNA-binding transcriptional repressor) of toxin-antitoxin stability system